MMWNANEPFSAFTFGVDFDEVLFAWEFVWFSCLFACFVCSGEEMRMFCCN